MDPWGIPTVTSLESEKWALLITTLCNLPERYDMKRLKTFIFWSTMTIMKSAIVFVLNAVLNITEYKKTHPLVAAGSLLSET